MNKHTVIGITYILFILLLDIRLTYIGLFGRGWSIALLLIATLPLTVHLIIFFFTFRRVRLQKGIILVDKINSWVALTSSLLLTGVYVIGFYQSFDIVLILPIFIAVFSTFLNIMWLRLISSSNQNRYVPL